MSQKPRFQVRVNARIVTCNDTIDKSEREEHLKFFAEFFLHFLLQKQFLKFEKRDLSARKYHKKRNFMPVEFFIKTFNLTLKVFNQFLRLGLIFLELESTK